MLQTSRKLFWAGLFITLLQTALVLGWSARQGRLALPVYFDDNHSMVDGARRLEIWYHQGLMAVLRDYVAHPPHAPGHALLAAASFALFGFQEWAPYLSNALFFGLILFALHLALIGSNSWIEIICMLLLAATPIAGLSILEFRSEVNVAELGTLGMLLFLTWSRNGNDRFFPVASSLCFAACFFIKPAVFPYTLGLMALCLLYHIRLFFRPGELRPPQLVSMALFILLAILLPLPHYLLDWHHITGYIGAIAFSHSSVWLRHDSFFTGLLFNLTGYPGMIMLGGFVKPSLLLIGAAVLLRCFLPNRWPAWLPLLPLVFFTMGAYAGVTVNPMNQNYFGMTFHWLLIITALVSLCGLAALIPLAYRSPALLFLGVLSVVLFFGIKFPLSIDFYREKAGNDPDIFSWLQRSPELVMTPIRHEHERTGATKVWITAYTLINARTLEWYTLVHREPYLYRDFIENDWRAVPRSLEWADVVVVPEQGTPSLETIIPNAAMATQMVKLLDHDARFELVQCIPSPHNGPGFRIYSKKIPSHLE
jgi:4-amino-4-deoxy-L-arabinose transferase-like glycosyltransferase